MAVKSNLLNMSLVLTLVCLVCSALLGGAYVLTKDPIEAAKQAKTNQAVAAVLPAFEQAMPDTVTLNNVDYVCYKAVNGEDVVGYAIESSVSGFGGALKVLVGITPDGLIYDTDVLENNETPGLGAKCAEKESLFRRQWQGFNPREKTLAVKKDGGDIDAITASTITSRAYTEAVHNAIAAFDLLTGAETTDAATGASVHQKADDVVISSDQPVIPSEAKESLNNGGQNNE